MEAEIDLKYLEFERNHQARLSIEVKKTTGSKIDSYIEELGELSYISGINSLHSKNMLLSKNNFVIKINNCL